jgi:hypothetical protein
VDTGQGRTYGGGVTGPGDQQGQPGPYGGSPPGGSPYGGPPYGDTPGQAPQGGPGEPPYVYNPYGNVAYPASYPSAPAGLGNDEPLPVRRPRAVHLALVLTILATVPYLLVGLLATLGASSAAAAVPPEDLAQLQALGVDLEQVVRTTGTIVLVVALIFVLLAVLAWTGRTWARALAAAMAAGFVLMVGVVVAGAASQGVATDGASLLLLVLPVGLALAGVALLFGAAAREWFAGARR